MYVKLTNRDSNHNGFQYKEGPNWCDDFDPEAECDKGLYFTDLENWWRWCSYGHSEMCWIWDVEPLSQVIIEDAKIGKYKAHGIKISNRRYIYDLVSADMLNKIVKHNCFYPKNLLPKLSKNPNRICNLVINLFDNGIVYNIPEFELTDFWRDQVLKGKLKKSKNCVLTENIRLEPVLQLIVVSLNPDNIKIIFNPTIQAKELAILQDPKIIRYFKVNELDEKTQDICAIMDPCYLIKSNSPGVDNVLKCISFNKSIPIGSIKLHPDEQLKLVNIDAKYIKYLADPTEQAQLAAVNVQGTLLMYIKNPTKEVKLAAIKQSPLARRFAKV